MKIFFKKLIADFSYYFGFGELYGYFLRDKIFVLCYHSIGHPDNKMKLSGELYENLSVSAEEFEKQIEFLKGHGHTFGTFTDLPRIMAGRSVKPTLIYFDDGYKDNLLNALPILKKHGISATVFVSTGLIERTHFLWTLKHRYFLRESGASSEEIEKAITRLKSLSMIEREKYFAEQYGGEISIFDSVAFNIFLDWNDLRMLVKNGWEIGAHGVTHCALTESDRATIRSEMMDSCQMIEKKIGGNVKSFSFPYGRFNDVSIDILRAAGYRFAVSAGAGTNDRAVLDNKLCFLRTIGVRPSDRLSDFAFKLYVKNFIKRIL